VTDLMQCLAVGTVLIGDRQNYGHPEREEIPFRPLLRHGA